MKAHDRAPAGAATGRRTTDAGHLLSVCSDDVGAMVIGSAVAVFCVEAVPTDEVSGLAFAYACSG